MIITPNTYRAAARLSLATATASLGLLAAGSPAASAATTTSCNASALQLSLLGAAAINPIQANPAITPCLPETGGLDLSQLGAITASAVNATTTVSPADQAVAHGQVLGPHLGAGSFVSTLSTALTSGTNNILPQVDTALSPLVAPGGVIATALAPLSALGLNVTSVNTTAVASTLTSNLTGVLSSTLPDIVNAGAVGANATAICTSGVAALSGSRQLTGVQVLGSPVDANDPAGKVLSLDTSHISLSQLVSLNNVLQSIQVQAAPLSPLALVLGSGTQSLYSVLVTPGGLLGTINALLPVGSTLGTVLSGLSTATQPLLDSTQINLPAGLLHAVVTPGTQTTDGSTLTETALDISVTALSQPIVSGSVSRASVSANTPGCVTTDPPKDPRTPIPGGGPALNSGLFSSRLAELELQCSSRPLRLLDVRPSKGGTFIEGVAQKQFVGKTADVYLRYHHTHVGKAVVQSTGIFAVRVAAPPKSIRWTNKARYFAGISSKRTEALKYGRRMQTTKVTTSAGSVTFVGRTTTPRAKNQRPVVVEQRVACGSYKRVTTVKPNAKGAFTASFKAPAGSPTIAIYRARTAVPLSVRSKKPFATFTLPRALNLTQ